MTEKRAAEITRLLTIYAAIIAITVIFGSLIFHRTSIIWELGL